MADADSLERLRSALHSAAHLLPSQSPIGGFVHHNTLHAFQARPFLEAVEAAAEIHEAEPYLSLERFREELRAGRVQREDLALELDLELTRRGLDGAERLVGDVTRRALWQLLVEHELEPLAGAPLRWTLSEGGRSRRLRTTIPGVARARILGETRAWFQGLGAEEQIRALDGERPAELREALGIEPEAVPALTWRDPEALAAGALQAACRSLAASLERPRTPARRDLRPRDRLLRLGCSDADALVHPFLIRWLVVYLDQGQAYWPLDQREAGLWDCLRASWSQPGCLAEAWQGGLRAALREAAAPAEVALAELGRLGVSPKDWEPFLERTLLALPGWFGMAQVLEENPGAAPHAAPPLDLLELCALRLLLDRVAAEHVARKELGVALNALPAPASPADDPEARAWLLREVAEHAGIAAPDLHAAGREGAARLFQELERFPDVHRRRVWHLAYERAHRDEVLSAVRSHWKEASGLELPAPRVQVVFCIDEREESIRRHLEELGPQFQTWGAAGFYGLAIAYQGIDDPHTAALCPAAAVPTHRIRERPREERLHTPRHARRRLVGSLQHLGRVSSRHVLGGLLSTAGLGLVSAFPLVSATLFPRLTDRLAKRWTLDPKPPTELTALRGDDDAPAEGELPLGYTVAEAAARVGTLLEDMGLVEGFAPLVAVLGHGSQSLNNPHESAHDCGACAGQHGGPNARLFAALANDPRVRSALEERGITIPGETWFVGGFHDTATSGVDVFDLDLVPETHQDVLVEFLDGVERARTLSAHERCRRFENAPLSLTPAEALRHVEARATHLAEPRPEYGHATNALCFVGRRAWSRGLFLDRRAFLVSYDPAHDPTLDVLTRILNAVGPVGAGINLEYYFSYVDNERYGCGTKLPHNVTALLGVMNGHQSDLRPGLPWQMVEIHEPVRLLTVVEATPEALGEVASRSPGVGELVTGGWINLVSLDPETGHLAVFTDGGFHPFVPAEGELPAAPTSVDYYLGRRGHLPPARIAAGLETCGSLGAEVRA